MTVVLSRFHKILERDGRTDCINMARQCVDAHQCADARQKQLTETHRHCYAVM